MKLSNNFALITSLFTTAHALVGTSWSVTNVPTTGLTDITFPITIVQADHISGYFFAQQYDFGGLSGTSTGYTGVQPRPDSGGRPVLHGVFSSFIPGSTTTDANCHSGADSGAGVSCSVEWNGVYGHKYNFEVRTTGNRVWTGTVIDTVTGQRIHIGSYTLPAGATGIKNHQLGFIEWYPWNAREPLNHCALLPYQQTMFGNPTTTHSGSVGTQDTPWEYGDCVGKVAFHTAKVTGGVITACGFAGKTGY